jgi:DNA ligase-1
MQDFTALYVRLDQSNATNDKMTAMVDYLASADPADAAWAMWFLSGRRLKRLVKRAALKAWVLEATGYPEWILDETYQSVGDMAETIALLLPEPTHDALAPLALHRWVTERLRPLGKLDEAQQGQAVQAWWAAMTGNDRFVLNKLLTGALRVGVSQKLVTRALAEHLALEPALIAHRMMGDWQPSAEFMAYLATGEGDFDDSALPYPFFLAAPLTEAPAALGDAASWIAEWKWDGIRAQLLHRSGNIYIWSRGEERMDGRFPELERAARALPDGTVLDGEVLATDNDGRVSFAALQRRIGRLKPGPKLLAEVPVFFMAYDLLETDGADIRHTPLAARRALLERLLAPVADSDPILRVSPSAGGNSWGERAALREESRARDVEGLMLKHQDSVYGTGRQRGSWWKWKVDPYTIDAVLIYAQPGSGRRSNLLTDYTFAAWRGDELVPVCKAYSGLSNEEIGRVDKWIRANTTERFGPVRAVTPTLVFEIAFEGINLSRRHKSGIAFRFPRISRWREDLGIKDAETLDQIKALIAPASQPV